MEYHILTTTVGTRRSEQLFGLESDALRRANTLIQTHGRGLEPVTLERKLQKLIRTGQCVVWSMGLTLHITLHFGEKTPEVQLSKDFCRLPKGGKRGGSRRPVVMDPGVMDAIPWL